MTNAERYLEERMTANDKRFNDAEELRKASGKTRFTVERIVVKDVRPCTRCGLRRMLSDDMSDGTVVNFCPACGRKRRAS